MDPIPAHLLNAFVYCPRLFYLEDVQGRFEDFDDTVLGRDRHHAVDQPRGAAPPPDEGEVNRARSVSLSSTDLGVSARIDVVEGADGWVVPVEIKKGRPQSEGQPWPSHRAQVVAQAMLLKEAGYACSRADVYYADVHQRLTVEVSETEQAWARSVIRDAFVVRDLARAPAPLVDSPKCDRCSLAGICLPDETNHLTGEVSHTARRVLPRDPDTRPAYVTEPGASVKVRHEQLMVHKDGAELAAFRLLDVAQLAVFGRVQVSTPALHVLFDRRIPVLWFSFGGWLKGWSSSPPDFYAQLRRSQVLAHSQGGWGLPNRFVEGKIRNARTLLRRHLNGKCGAPAELRQLAAQADTCTSMSSLLGVEGMAARRYFEAFPELLKQPSFQLAFRAGGRNRRPPTDQVNALLSFCYALLTKDLVATALGIGLDPHLGLYHSTRGNRPALALDLAEEFRPLIADSVVLRLVNHHEIDDADFLSRAGAVNLTPRGCRKVIHAYENRLAKTVRHPEYGYELSYRRVLDLQARLLAATLVGDVEEYHPMVTR